MYIHIKYILKMYLTHVICVFYFNLDVVKLLISSNEPKYTN